MVPTTLSYAVRFVANMDEAIRFHLPLMQSTATSMLQK